MDATALVHLVTEPTRHRLLTALLAGERTVTHLTAAAASEQSNVSHHLRTLRDAGVVRVRSAGRQRHYRLADEEVTRLLGELRALADGLERSAYLATLQIPTGPGFHGYG